MNKVFAAMDLVMARFENVRRQLKWIMAYEIVIYL